MGSQIEHVQIRPRTPWRLDPEARYGFWGRHHKLHHSADGVHSFKETAEPYATVSLADAELRQLHNDGALSIEPRYFSRQKAFIRTRGQERLLSHVKPKARIQALFTYGLCQAFERAQGEVLQGIRQGPVDHGDCLDTLLPQFTKEIVDAWNTGARKGDVLLYGGLQPPCPRHFTRLFRDYQKARHPAVFLRKNGATGNRKMRSDPAELAVRIEEQRGYASPKEPSYADCYRMYEARIVLLNQDRERDNLPSLRPVDIKAFTAGIKGLCQFWVHERRFDRQSALEKFGGGSGGFEDFRPCERVELDEWQIDLVALLVYAGVWKDLGDAERAAVKRARLWASVALDAASRVTMAAIVHARKPNSDTAIELLELAVTDKSGMAAHVGARCTFPYAATIKSILPDNGAGFRSDRFHAAAHDIGTDVLLPQAGRPKARAHIERAFRTFSMEALPNFSGRTFSNVVQKGDVDPSEKANVPADSFTRGFFRYLIDHYNHAPHPSLGGLSPHDAWMRMTENDPPEPPPTEDKLRHAFGLEFERVVSKDGIRFLGIQYNLPEIQAFFGKKVTVRISRLEVSVASFWDGVDWIDVPSVLDVPRGLTVYEIEHAWREFDKRFDSRKAMHMEFVLSAARELREIGEAADRVHRVDPLWDRGAERTHFDRLDRERFPYAIKWKNPGSEQGARLLDLCRKPDEPSGRHYELPPGYRSDEPVQRPDRYEVKPEETTTSDDAQSAPPAAASDADASDAGSGAFDNPDDFEF